MGAFKIIVVLILLTMLFGFFLLFGDYIILALDRLQYDDGGLEALTCVQLTNQNPHNWEYRQEIAQVMKDKNY